MDLQNIDQRLKALHNDDPVSTEQIQKSIDSGKDPNLPNISSKDSLQTVKDWLNEQENDLDLIIAAGTGNNNEISILLDLTPPDCQILLIERNPARAAQLFRTCPVEEYVKSKKLFLAIGEDKTHIANQFMTIMDIRNSPKFKIFDPFPLEPEDSEFHTATLLDLRNMMRARIFNVATLMNLGTQWQRNCIKNIPKLISSQGINALKDLFPGKPALVIAAGPSLNNALDVIADIAPHFVKICVAQALHPIHNAGIKPDLVMAVDANPVTMQQLKVPCDDTFLACSSVVPLSVLDRFKGIFSGHINSNPIGIWISSLGNEKGPIFPGGTVTSGAIDLALQMGCDPIITVGLDLSVAEDGTSHAKDTMYHGQKLDKEKLIPVPGNFVDTVFTKSDFRVYIDIIGNYISRHKERRFINANDSGAKIKGMDVITHKEIKDLAKEELAAYSRISKVNEKSVTCDYEQIHNEIEIIIEQMHITEKNAIKGAMLCNRLIMLLQMPDSESESKATEILDKLKNIDEDIQKARESSLLLDMSLRNAYFRVGKKPKDYEKQYSPAVFANKESRTLYQEIAFAASWTSSLLSETIDELHEPTENTPPTAQNLQETICKSKRKIA